MSTVLTTSYHPPVDQLLALDDCRGTAWPDYGRMGFGPEHVPELIRVSTDPELNFSDSDSVEVWAPVHAWRVLGMLRAPEAVEPLLGLLEELEDSDWPGEELPWVFGQIGPSAIPALSAYLGDASRDLWGRITASGGLAKIAQAHPATRAEIVARLVEELDKAGDGEIAGFMISRLMDLRAVEAAPAIERAFAEDRVELGLVGDWEDVQVELGLLEKRITRRHNPLERMAWAAADTPAERDALLRAFGPPGGQRVAGANDSARAKGKAATAKRKQQKESRKKNRRRKR